MFAHMDDVSQELEEIFKQLKNCYDLLKSPIDNGKTHPYFTSEVPQETTGDRLRKLVRYSLLGRGVRGTTPPTSFF